MGVRKENLFDPVAVTGMACRFPGAANADSFWKNLSEGVESVREISVRELEASGISAEVYSRPEYIRARAVLDDIDKFDAWLFDFSPREAELTDPQQRVSLECAWEALEQAGYLSDPPSVSIGVFTGAAISTYLFDLYAGGSVNPSNSFRTLLGNDKDHLSTWISYKLNLRGPSLNVQTACSTSLVAVHLACRSLQNFECEAALAGGVSIGHPQHAGYTYEEGGIYSHDGHCRAFDAESRGSVPGNGVGFVVLKRLDDAVRDRDNILAIIRGSAINNDGAAKVGYTAPSVDGQAAVIAAAQQAAGIPASSIDYVETHGSGTSLGDLIEATALAQVFGADAKRPGSLSIGSVKTNIGHCGQAAGVAGLIKAILSVHHGIIPPSLHFSRPNPQIDFVHGPLKVNTQAAEWKTNGTPRRAAVSSFGIGGTNAHLIVEQSPPLPRSGRTRSRQLLLLSAKTPDALEKATSNLADCLESNRTVEIADAAFTLQTGRKRFGCRRAVLCSDAENAIQALRTRDSGQVFTATRENDNSSVAFLFPGVGDHYTNMALELFENEPVFRERIDFCCDYLQKNKQIDLRGVLFSPDQRPVAPNQAVGTLKPDLRQMLRAKPIQGENEILRDARTGQPALFVMEYALAHLWMSWGIKPAAMLGYSLGEYVAACMAGVFSIEDALSLIAGRADIIRKLPPGSMIAVGLSREAAAAYVTRNVTPAAVMGASECVLTGPRDDVEKLIDVLKQKGIAVRPVQTSHAVHSPMMRPAIADLLRLFSKIKLSAPAVPFISNVTGAWITEDQAVDPEYWASHLCEPVQLHAGMSRLVKDYDCLLEVGPGALLSSFAIQASPTGDTVALPSLRPSYAAISDTEFLLRTLGQLWLAGVRPDWNAFHDGHSRSRIPLPAYPFERQRYWMKSGPVEPRQRSAEAGPAENGEDLPEESRVSDNGSPTLYPRRFLSAPFVSPSTVTEETIAYVWQELLGIEGVGIHDNFFQMGGTSLLALTVTARLRQAFQIELPLPAIFQAPTVAELAVVMEEMLVMQLQNPEADVPMPDPKVTDR